MSRPCDRSGGGGKWISGRGREVNSPWPPSGVWAPEPNKGHLFGRNLSCLLGGIQAETGASRQGFLAPFPWI